MRAMYDTQASLLVDTLGFLGGKLRNESVLRLVSSAHRTLRLVKEKIP